MRLFNGLFLASFLVFLLFLALPQSLSWVHAAFQERDYQARLCLDGAKLAQLALLVLLGSLLFLATSWLLGRAGARFRRAARIPGDDQGAVLSVEFALIFPMLLVLLFSVFQWAELMVNDSMVHYAAFCAARTASTWLAEGEGPVELPPLPGARDRVEFGRPGPLGGGRAERGERYKGHSTNFDNYKNRLIHRAAYYVLEPLSRLTPGGNRNLVRRITVDWKIDHDSTRYGEDRIRYVDVVPPKNFLTSWPVVVRVRYVYYPTWPFQRLFLRPLMGTLPDGSKGILISREYKMRIEPYRPGPEFPLLVHPSEVRKMPNADGSAPAAPNNLFSYVGLRRSLSRAALHGPLLPPVNDRGEEFHHQASAFVQSWMPNWARSVVDPIVRPYERREKVGDCRAGMGLPWFMAKDGDPTAVDE